MGVYRIPHMLISKVPASLGLGWGIAGERKGLGGTHSRWCRGQVGDSFHGI